MTQTRFELSNARKLAERYIKDSILPGDTVIDATMGNGGDTERLCRLVGETGRVYAFDIQEDALASTARRLEAAELLKRTSLILDGHEHMESYVKDSVQAVVFNLGWLPGGNHAVTTKAETTLEALQAALRLIRPGGLVSVCIYPGHEEGKTERDRIVEWAGTLSVQRYNVLLHRFLNAGESTPVLVLIQKNRV